MFRKMLVSGIFRQFVGYFGLFDIAGLTQYMYIVDKYKSRKSFTTEEADGRITRG
jgi:hypothetical protein